jgi:basic membrane protein A
MRIRPVAMAAVVLAAAAGLAAVSAAAARPSHSAAPSKNVALAMPNQRNDHSFGQASYNGMVAAKQKYGVKITILGGLVDPQANVRGIANLAKTNGLVIATSTAQTAAILAAAKQYPNVHFVLTDGVLPKLPNTNFVLPDWYGPGFLAGVVAATASKTHTVGFVGGALITPITQGRAGFTAGAKYVDPSTKVLQVITGDFTDPVKAKNAAAAQIATGADVIWAQTDSAHAGIIQAIKDSGKPVQVIGAIAPKCADSNGYDIGDVLLNQSALVTNIVRDYLGGKLKNLTYRLQDPSVQLLLFCPGKGSAKLTSALKKATAGLRSGKIHYP